MPAPLVYTFDDITNLDAVLARLHASTAYSNDTQVCWPWLGQKIRAYGVLKVKVLGRWRHLRVHRLAYEEEYGAIPVGFVVAHHCDTPHCVRPNHLFACPQSENVRDMARKNRSCFGSRNAHAIVREEDIPTILQMDQEGIPYKVIGQKFGVAGGTILAICRGHSWVRSTGLGEDAKHKPRRDIGERNHSSKLRTTDIPEIILLRNTKHMTYVAIAARYNVSYQVIRSICRGETWSHISGLLPPPRKSRRKEIA